MPRVSIITPAYNMARFLPAAIDSALSQDYEDKEIVVLDDGSQDDTAAVVRAYGDKVRYHWQPNEGVANSYNRLMRLAQGEYVHVLDADDVLMPGTISANVAMLDKYPSAAMVYGDAVVVDEHGKPYGRRTAPAWIGKTELVPSRKMFKELLKGCHITNSTVMVRRGLFDEIGPYEQESVPGEDWDMWLRTSVNHDVAHVPRPLAYYRTHSGSLTSGYTIEMVHGSHLHTLDKIFGAPNFKYADLRGYAYACLHRTVAVVAARGRHRSEFARNFATAVRHSPSVLRDRETASVAIEGLKTLLPKKFIAAGRTVKRSFTRGIGATIG